MSLVQAVFQGLGLTHGQAQPRHNLGRLDDESAVGLWIHDSSSMSHESAESQEDSVPVPKIGDSAVNISWLTSFPTVSLAIIFGSMKSYSQRNRKNVDDEKCKQNHNPFMHHQHFSYVNLLLP